MIGNDSNPLSHLPSHARCVESWLAKQVGSEAGSDRTAPALIVGVRALWDRARPALGEVTLGAIFRRAIETGTHQHPALAALGLRITDGGALMMSNLPAPRAELREAVTFLLVEITRVLAGLSGGALTVGLHAGLTDATVDAPHAPHAPHAHDGAVATGAAEQVAPAGPHHHEIHEHQRAET